MRIPTRLATLLAVWLSVPASAAGPLLRNDVPSPLKPWTDWALWNTEASLCPFFQGNGDNRRCAWPTKLALALDDRGGQFTQSWRIHVKGWVPLPGNDKRWPQAVRVDGAPAPVALHENRPSVFLTPGVHAITGGFVWNPLPESLTIPEETGLLALTVRGKPVEFPNRDEAQVWLQKAAEPEEGEKLEVVVHRKVTDEIPLLLATHIELSVAGKSREVVLGKSLPVGFFPMVLAGPLPVRLEPDSRLRVQVRPGTWSIELVARSEGPVKQLGRPVPDGPWREGEEIWVFEARNELRVVTIEGVSAIDPQQTLLSDDWKRLPAYLMKIGDVLKLVEKRRGDSDPAPDQLTLNRNLWLDFDGAGYAVSDEITGRLNRTWRLEMAPPTVLGRVSVDHRDQFITAGPGSQYRGAEVRQGQLHVNADSRIPGRLADIPAVGWNHDFQKVSAELHLPPGWRLFHASGVDSLPETWIKHWTLLEFFLALIIAVAASRLYGIASGALALVTLVLIFPEQDAPQWVWLALFAGEALVRALPSGRLQSVLKLYRLGAWVVLIVIAIPFAAQHLRHAIYPALARESYPPHFPLAALKLAAPRRAAEPPTQEVAESMRVDQVLEEEDKATGGVSAGTLGGVVGGLVEGGAGGKGIRPRTAAPSEGKRKANVLNAQEYDPGAMVQTGAGVPKWQWESLSLRWSGPVERSQQLHLSLWGPNVNRVLAFLRIALLAALVVWVLRSSRGLMPPALGKRLGLKGALTLGGLALLGNPQAARADFPTREMLDQLRDRLLVRPECIPSCASASRLQLEIRPTRLRGRLEVDASAETAIPLPGSSDQWSAEQILLDGQPARALLRSNDQLWISLTPGRHQIDLDGALPVRETIQLSLHLRPHQIKATSEGWKLEGLHEDGLADDNLQLTRVHTAKESKLQALQSAALPPFVRITRTLLLGLHWQVDTQVERLTPKGTAVVLEVPLLSGESVTTADIRTTPGKALLNLGPQVDQISWRSVLEQASSIRLSAPKTLSWTEVWKLDVGPVWHVNLSGIPVVHQQTDKGAILPEWRPWPGEEVVIEVVRPRGVTGETLTIDQTELRLSPGLRATDAELAISLRSSRGGQHTVMLPEAADLQSVAIGGATQPIRQDGRRVLLPLSPGSQSVLLKWRQPQGIATVFRTPEVNLGANSVNAKTQINVPGNRWILFLGGPRLGPAVLFWSLLVIIVLVAVALGRSQLTPLRSWQWVLLAIGLSQVPMLAAAIVAGWLSFLAWRREKGAAIQSTFWFDVQQLLIIGWTLTALLILAVAIHQGLLGTPEMQISGNGSSYGFLYWFQDRTGAVLPRPWILSVPLMVYRLAMLAWALWLALAVLRWLRWGWGAFTAGGSWRRQPKKAQAVDPAGSAP